MKKIVSMLLIFTLIFANLNIVFSKAVSTYENLLLLNDEFITRIQEGGVSNEQVKKFIDDVDEYIGDFKEDIYMSDIDLYFISILLQIMQEEDHIPILIAFDLTYQEEIKYMSENKKVPKNLVNFMLIAFDNKIIIEDPKIKNDPIDTNDEKEESEKPEQPNLPESLPFSDIADLPWCIESVVSLYKAGVINGTEEGIFSPNKMITREEFLKLLVLALLDMNDMYLREFGQGGRGTWFHPYLASADFYSLIQGIYDAKEFAPDVYITRQDMATIAFRAASRAKIEFPNLIKSTDFFDISSFSYYSVMPIKELQEAEIIKGVGDNFFSPNFTTTRAEATKIVYNLYKLKIMD